MAEGGALREIFARFGIEADSKKLVQLNLSVTEVAAKIQQLVFGVVEAGEAVVQFAVDMARTADDINDSAMRLGISTQALQEYRHAAILAGVDSAQLGNSLRLLQRNAANAASGQKAGVEAFRQLGVQAKGADGQVRSIESLLPDLADGFKAIDNPAKRTQLAMQLFGRSGQMLLPFLAQGSEGIAELREEFQRLGGGASEDMIKNSAQLDDDMRRLDLTIFSLKTRLANTLIPILTSAVEALYKINAGILKLTKGSHILQAGLIGIAVGFGVILLALTPFLAVMAVFLAGPILAVGLFVAAIGFLILIIDDLITFLTGGKSAIGAFIDEMFGAGAAKETMVEILDIWREIVASVTAAKEAVQDFFSLGDKHPAAPNAPGTTGQRVAAGISRFLPASVRSLMGIPEAPTAGGAPQIEAYARGRTALTPARVAEVPATLSAGRVATVARRHGPGAAGGTVDARAHVTINVPPGTDRAHLAAIQRTVHATIDQRNRQAAAALGQESEPGEE